MKRENIKWIRPIFFVAGLYDSILGILFLLIPLQLFNLARVQLPAHLGFVQFAALFFMIFALMFFNIAKDPIANKNLILYGILLKGSYCIVVFPYWLVGNVGAIWVPFAFIDLLFVVVFIAAQIKLNLHQKS